MQGGACPAEAANIRQLVPSIHRGPVCRIERVRYTDGVPMMREIRYISLASCPGIERKPLEDSLYDLNERDYSLQLTQVDQTLNAIQVPAELLSLFGLEVPVAAFRVEGVTFCCKEIILEMADSIYGATCIASR